MNDLQTYESQQPTGEFRIFLQKEFMTRCKQIPGYSLRAFARALHLDPTALSRLLSGKRQANAATIEKIAAALGLGPAETEKLKGSRRSAKASKKADADAPSFTQITEDTFLAISHWYYLAILELTYTKDFRPDEGWIAQVLGISKTEVSIAREVLCRLGFLEIKKDKWIDKYTHFSGIQDNFTSAGLRSFQLQILEKAVIALQETDISKRDQTAITFAANSQLIDKAKVKVTEFRRELSEYMQSTGPRDSVYVLSMSLFPVTKIKSGFKK